MTLRGASRNTRRRARSRISRTSRAGTRTASRRATTSWPTCGRRGLCWSGSASIPLRSGWRAGSMRRASTYRRSHLRALSMAAKRCSRVRSRFRAKSGAPRGQSAPRGRQSARARGGVRRSGPLGCSCRAVGRLLRGSASGRDSPARRNHLRSAADRRAERELIRGRVRRPAAEVCLHRGT